MYTVLISFQFIFFVLMGHIAAFTILYFRVTKINKSIKIIARELDRTVDAAVNKSGEDFRNILGIRNMIEESPVLGEYDYVNDRFERFHPYQKEISKRQTNDASRRRNEFNENDTTAEFHSPLRGVKQNNYNNDNDNDANAPPTVPRYSNTGGTVGRYQPQIHQPKRYSASVGGRLNLSEIPIIDSGSDHSSPNALSPSDEEKESPQMERSTYGIVTFE